MTSKKSTKKLTPGNFKSGAGGGKTSTRRTGRTTGISQSAFAGYAFQGKPTAESSVEAEAVDKADVEAEAEDTTKPATDG